MLLADLALHCSGGTANMQKPKAPIRRFDVFAEFNRQKAIEDGMEPDEAEGYGLWVAKVVASRGFGRGAGSKPPGKGDEGALAEGEETEEEKPKWHSLDGKPQTDELFQRDVVSRMGREFYESVFRPAIEEAYREGKSYQSIRDTIRRDWKP
jgi:hypothetical protein